MLSTYLTENELKSAVNEQIFLLEKGLHKSKFDISTLGDIIPGSVMLQDIAALQVTYMNKLGCDVLNHSMDEISGMGKDYYDKFFVAEEINHIIPSLAAYFQKESNRMPYSFFQRVRTGPDLEWYFTTCKFIDGGNDTNSSELLLISNPVQGMGLMVNKVGKVLEEHTFVSRNYKKFALLTKREKQIIKLLAEGKTTKEISDFLFLSHHTVSTHRKNIGNKLELDTFSALLKFATAFELIK